MLFVELIPFYCMYLMPLPLGGRPTGQSAHRLSTFMGACSLGLVKKNSHLRLSIKSTTCARRRCHKSCSFTSRQWPFSIRCSHSMSVSQSVSHSCCLPQANTNNLKPARKRPHTHLHISSDNLNGGPDHRPRWDAREEQTVRRRVPCQQPSIVNTLDSCRQ